MTENSDTEPEAPGDGPMLYAVPQDRPRLRAIDPEPAPTGPRRRGARKPAPLPWQPAHWIELRGPGNATERVEASAVAVERDWVTVRRDENGRPRVTAYPAWRVTEIELRHPN